jgi:predicted DNA-binding protein
MAMKRILIQVTAATDARVRGLSKLTGKPYAEIYRRCVEEALPKVEFDLSFGAPPDELNETYYWDFGT